MLLINFALSHNLRVYVIFSTKMSLKYKKKNCILPYLFIFKKILDYFGIFKFIKLVIKKFSS